MGPARRACVVSLLDYFSLGALGSPKLVGWVVVPVYSSSRSPPRLSLSPHVSFVDTPLPPRLARFAGLARSLARPLARATHLDRNNLRIQLPTLIRRHTRRNNGPTNSTRTSQRGLAWQEYVGDVLVFTEEREVEEDLDGFGVYGSTGKRRRGGEEGSSNGKKRRREGESQQREEEKRREAYRQSR